MRVWTYDCEIGEAQEYQPVVKTRVSVINVIVGRSQDGDRHSLGSSCTDTHTGQASGGEQLQIGCGY